MRYQSSWYTYLQVHIHAYTRLYRCVELVGVQLGGPPHFYQVYGFCLGALLKQGGTPKLFLFQQSILGGPPNEQFDLYLGGPPNLGGPTLFYHWACLNLGVHPNICSKFLRILEFEKGSKSGNFRTNFGLKRSICVCNTVFIWAFPS